jgi:hypothetical protein
MRQKPILTNLAEPLLLKIGGMSSQPAASPLNWLKESTSYSGGHNEAACGPNDLARNPG